MLLNDIYVKVQNKLKKYFYQSFGYPYLLNWNKQNEKTSKRLLFVYQVTPFIINQANKNFYEHHSYKQAVQIAEIFYTRGYTVDIYDYKEGNIRPKYLYDVVISHNSGLDITSDNFTNSRKIYFASGQYHPLTDSKKRVRYESLLRRSGVRLSIQRKIPENNKFVEHADVIVGFGNEIILDTWKEVYHVPTYPFNNYGYSDTKWNPCKKNYSECKRNFLFYSGGDMVGKGLDLLLEIFSKRKDVNLFVCAPFKNEKEFTRYFKKELYCSSNIFPVGVVNPLGKKYYEITNKCAFVIHPSAAEGQPGGVIQCMHSGLIPVISSECGIETGDYGFELKECSIEEINITINSLIKYDASWVMEMSKNVREHALCQYSEDKFKERWNHIVECFDIIH